MNKLLTTALAVSIAAGSLAACSGEQDPGVYNQDRIATYDNGISPYPNYDETRDHIIASQYELEVYGSTAFVKVPIGETVEIPVACTEGRAAWSARIVGKNVLMTLQSQVPSLTADQEQDQAYYDVVMDAKSGTYLIYKDTDNVDTDELKDEGFDLVQFELPATGVIMDTSLTSTLRYGENPDPYCQSDGTETIVVRHMIDGSNDTYVASVPGSYYEDK